MADFTPIKADDGYYVSLFPMMYLNCTQTWGAGTLSHRNHQSDWTGATKEYPYYACCDMTCYDTTSSGYIWTSDTPVHTPSGLSYISVWVAHDNNASRATVGTKIKAGALMGRTGVRGYATGDHLHIDVALAHNAATASNGEALANDVNPAQAFYITNSYTVHNTTANGITISFPVWSGGTPQPPVTEDYTLSVINGSATATTGKAGTVVTITANNRTGYRFRRWSVSGSGTVGNATSSRTTFTFGSGNAIVTAEYLTIVTLTVTGGTPATYEGVNGEQITVTANIPSGGYMKEWKLEGGGSVSNRYASVITYTFSTSNGHLTAQIITGGSFPFTVSTFVKHKNKY